MAIDLGRLKRHLRHAGDCSVSERSSAFNNEYCTCGLSESCDALIAALEAADRLAEKAQWAASQLDVELDDLIPDEGRGEFSNLRDELFAAVETFGAARHGEGQQP